MITPSSPAENLEVISAASILLTLRADNRSPIRVPLLSSIDKETSESMRRKRPCGKCKQRKRRCTHKSDFPKGEAKSGETAVIQDIYPRHNIETEPGSRSEMRHEEKPLDPENFGKILQTSFVDTIPNFQYGQHGQQSDTESSPKDERCPKCESGTSCLRTDCAFVYASASELFESPKNFNPHNAVHVEIMQIFTRLSQEYMSRVKAPEDTSAWWSLNTHAFFNAIGIYEPGNTEYEALSKAAKDPCIKGLRLIKDRLDMEVLRKYWLEVDVLNAYVQVQTATVSGPLREGCMMLEYFFSQCCHETSSELYYPEIFWRLDNGRSFNLVIRKTLMCIIESMPSDA